MTYFKDKIKKTLEEIVGSSVSVDFCSDTRFGDYTTNIALQDKSLDPKDIAEKINSQNLDFEASVVGRFINFSVKKDVLVENLESIDANYAKNDLGHGETVIVEYSSPNIAKPFGIGHLRSTVIGQAIYNLYEFLGFNTVGDNHLGDWGTQFGKLLYMIERTKTKDLSIENLEKLYVEFHKLAEESPFLEEEARQWFKKLEDGDGNARTIWKQCVHTSLSEFQKIYNLLGVKIDNAYGESFYEEEMKQMMSDKKIKEKLKKGEKGALIIDLTSKGIKTPLMFLKSDGATTYATRDLATIAFRVKKYNPKTIIYEVGIEQKLHFQQIFAAARLLGLVGEGVDLVHIAHGLYLAPDGKKFSTRKGKTVKLEEVLEEAIEKAKKLGAEKSVSEAIAKKVGIGAIKYFDLMHAISSDVVFDWEKIMNMQGNSGPYLQYTYVRTQSVVEKAKKEGKSKTTELDESELDVTRSLFKFPEIVSDTTFNYSPNILCNYLFDLASKFNTFYQKNRIIGAENEKFRLDLTKATGQVIKTGLSLLGIETPEKM